MPSSKKEFCKRGHALTDENRNAHGRCKLCYKIRLATPEQKAHIKAYTESIRHKQLKKAVRNKPEHKTRLKTYLQSEEYKEKAKIWRINTDKKMMSELPDFYIAARLGLSVKVATPDVLILKRLTLTLRRRLKSCQTATKELQPQVK